jgi:hypothetical protein
MREMLIFILFLSVSPISKDTCVKKSTLGTEVRLNQYLDDIGIKVEDLSFILIIPLGGCENQIRPILEMLDTFYPCTEIENVLIVLDADFQNQLIQQTNFRLVKDLPSCVLFDNKTRAYFNGLVYFAPIIYSINDGELKDVIDANHSLYGDVLNRYFYFNLNRVI